MAEQFEGFFKGSAGTELFFQTWQASALKGHLVVTHGHGEHSDCYRQMAEDLLADLPLKIWAWDWRGHGRSQGPRGAASDFSIYTQDYEIFLRKVVQIDELKQPVILMGHSMGGLIQLKTLLGYPDWQIHPQILSAPLLGLALAVPKWKEKLSRIMYDLLPEITLDNELRFEDLSSDPKVLQSYRRDPFRHQKISAGVYEASLIAIQNVLSNAHKFHAPLLVFCSDNDPVVSTEKVAVFFEKVKSPEKTLKLFPGRKHEVINDLGREDAISLMTQFIKQQMSSSKS